MTRLTLALAACLWTLAVPGAFAQLIVPDPEQPVAVFGVSGGILVTIPPGGFDDRPDGGPRGLIRIGVELGGQRHLLNYVAVEPIVNGARGLSELERGADGRPGLQFELVRPPESASTSAAAPAPPPAASRPGVPWIVESGPDGRSVRVGIRTDRFRNGAEPIVELTVFEKRPREVRFRVYAAPGSAQIESLVLTATMGNQSRCRELWLADGTVHAHDLFSAFAGNGFADHQPFGLDRLHRTAEGDVVAAITPDESDPSEVRPLPNGAWRSTLPWCAQYWRKPAAGVTDALRVRVNGRRVYWGGRTPIPGGPAFENFELLEPFTPGVEQWFGVAFGSPQTELAFGYDRPPSAPITREVAASEAAAVRETERSSRRLDTELRPDLTGWHADAGAAAFRVFEAEGQYRLTTFGRGGDADTGRLWQTFSVPTDARLLRLWIHGGCDRERLRVALWDGERRYRAMTGRNDNTPFEVEWDLRPLRGRAVTLEVVDESREPWGFIGVHGIEIVPDADPR